MSFPKEFVWDWTTLEFWNGHWWRWYWLGTYPEGIVIAFLRES